jgi:hypothetical protein
MTCPHCSKSLTYKQRTGRKCGECRREFAFEPRGHPLALHDNRFRRIVKKLSENGELRYTADQLRHAVVRKPVAMQKQSGAGCTAATLVAAAIAGFVVGAALAPLAGLFVAGIIAIAGGVTISVRRLRPFVPSMPIGLEGFRSTVIDRWRSVYGEAPEGLVDQAAVDAMPPASRPTEKLDAVVVSPERDVLACLLANNVPKRLHIGLLPVAPPFDAWEQAVLERLQKDPTLPVLLLHDASAAGAFLARDLSLMLRLDPSHRIYDLGLNPKRSIHKKRLTIGREPGPLRARLDAELAEVSANVRPIRRGRARLTAEEIAWLSEGNSSPILAISPASLYKRLVFALDKIDSKRHPRRHDARAEAAARAVGFLTWPA